MKVKYKISKSAKTPMSIPLLKGTTFQDIKDYLMTHTRFDKLMWKHAVDSAFKSVPDDKVVVSDMFEPMYMVITINLDKGAHICSIQNGEFSFQGEPLNIADFEPVDDPVWHGSYPRNALQVVNIKFISKTELIAELEDRCTH